MRVRRFILRKRHGPLRVLAAVAVVLALAGVVSGGRADHAHAVAPVATAPAGAPATAPTPYFPDGFKLNAGPPEEHVQAF